MDDEVYDVIEHKIMKVNGEVGFKKYQRGKMLGKGMSEVRQAASPSAMRELTSKRRNCTR